MTLPLDVVVEVDAQEKVSQLQDLFSSAIRAQLQAMRCCLEQHHTKVVTAGGWVVVVAGFEKDWILPDLTG